MEINFKITQAKKLRDKLEELANIIDSIDSGIIKGIKDQLNNFINTDDDSTRTNIDSEVSKLIE